MLNLSDPFIPSEQILLVTMGKNRTTISIYNPKLLYQRCLEKTKAQNNSIYKVIHILDIIEEKI